MTFTLRDANGKVRPNFAELKQNADQAHREQLEQLHAKNEVVKNGGLNGKF